MEGPLLHLRQAIQPLRLATRRKRRVDELRDGGGERLGRRRCLERLVGDGAYGGGGGGGIVDAAGGGGGGMGAPSAIIAGAIGGVGGSMLPEPP